MILNYGLLNSLKTRDIPTELKEIVDSLRREGLFSKLIHGRGGKKNIFG